METCATCSRGKDVDDQYGRITCKGIPFAILVWGLEVETNLMVPAPFGCAYWEKKEE